ncbi:aminotransferase class I/II-fold pyridoxal phosphate-dependent enzyme [Flaviflexus massiliensis]|uniref:aminotransferase class I/II-fold pyridoxal phosphate-dependent enzyme n=1 Tax=Flaviflexus massiliensis TaxID=1522309 RepID=UPI0006D5A809|nr:aminotransferase class I/II-fold pyridoxal phosphate-dependent enzyme [Flaviflexus massiliensis]
MVTFTDQLAGELADIEEAGLTKRERLLTSPQAPHITTSKGPALNFCANNYLGLANNPEIIAAAHEGLDEMGFGAASVRFICGTHEAHSLLEQEIADFVGKEAAILFPSCFDANGALFEVLLTAEDAVISDSLNHASIIDGVRLSKAQRFRYANRDMVGLEKALKEASSARDT